MRYDPTPQNAWEREEIISRHRFHLDGALGMLIELLTSDLLALDVVRVLSSFDERMSSVAK